MTASREDPSVARAPRSRRPVEEQLGELVELGELSGLPGEGAPLRDDDPGTDPGWAARHVLHTANVVPPWAELRREIDERAARIRRRAHAHQDWLRDRTRLLAELPADRIVEATRVTAARDARVREELVAAVSEVNALIRRYDLLVIPALQLPLVTLERLTG